jgi:plasmid rolling circle replication initiator protein Rep
MSQAKWVTLWQSCLKTDYAPILDVRAVKSTKGTSDDSPEASNAAMLRAICETLKYAVKPSDLLADPKWLDELTKQLQKTRAVSVGGCLKEFFSEDDPEDLINDDILDFIWSTFVKRYKKGDRERSQEK